MSGTTLRELAHAVVIGCWIAFGVVWAAGYVYGVLRGPAARSRTRPGALYYAGILVAVALYASSTSLWARLTVSAAWCRWIGLPLLLAATAFTLWARLALGTMWSSSAVERSEHQLRTGGPYALTRHPIYTGMLAMILGSAFSLGLGRGLALFVVATVAVQSKIRAEEKMLTTVFPADYAEYRRRVPQLLPWPRPGGKITA